MNIFYWRNWVLGVCLLLALNSCVKSDLDTDKYSEISPGLALPLVKITDEGNSLGEALEMADGRFVMEKIEFSFFDEQFASEDLDSLSFKLKFRNAYPFPIEFVNVRFLDGNENELHVLSLPNMPAWDAVDQATIPFVEHTESFDHVGSATSLNEIFTTAYLEVELIYDWEQGTKEMLPIYFFDLQTLGTLYLKIN